MAHRRHSSIVAAAIVFASLLFAKTGLGAPATRVGPSPIAAWETWRVSAAREITAFVAHGTTEPAPLVVVLQGSPCHPLFRVSSENGRTRTQSTLPFGDVIASRALRQHFVAFDRRGLASFDGGDASKESRVCTAERGGVEKAERVDDAIAVIRAFRELPWVTDVWIAGHSEGADVASGVARAEPDLVSAIGLFAGAGPSQFFDDVSSARARGASSEAEDTFRALDAFTRGHPPAEYDGHPSARFMTYAVDSTVLDDATAGSSRVPVFVAHGTRDANVAIANADVFVVETMRRQKDRPLRYVVVEGAGHGFETDDGDAQSEVLAQFTTWAASKPRDRSFATLRATPRPARYVTRYFGIRDRVWFVALPLAGVAAVVTLAFRRRRRALSSAS